MEEIGLGLTMIVLLGGIVMRLQEIRRNQSPQCSVRQNTTRPLQVSCLAAQALGVQFFLRAHSFDVAPISFNTFGITCVVIGVAGLGVLSFFCDCRDDVLRES